MLGVPVEQAILESRQAEEVVLFLDIGGGLLVNRALAVDEFVFHEIRLARHAVLPAIHVGLDIARVVTRLQQLAHADFVALLGGANEVVVGDVESFPSLLEERGDGVGKGLWAHPSGIGRLLDLQAVFVGAGEQVHVVAEEAVPARDRIGNDRGVSVSEVRLGVDVINRCRCTECGGFGHRITLMVDFVHL